MGSMSNTRKEIAERLGFAADATRPGAKAEFAADAREVGQEILRQLGGGRFMAMVGGKNAMHGMFGGKPGLQVSIGKGAEGGINRVIITLDPATDTYRMEFWKIAKGGMSTQKVSEASMVYADDLQRVFTDRTKFYTSMSRPGAKVKSARIDSSMLDGSMREVPIILKDGNHAVARKSASGWKVDGHADIPAFAKLRDLVAHMDKMGFSRPGAKSTHAYKVGDRVHGAVLVRGGAGVVGTITKIEDGYAYIKSDSSDRFGPVIHKVPVHNLSNPPKKAWESAKAK